MIRLTSEKEVNRENFVIAIAERIDSLKLTLFSVKTFSLRSDRSSLEKKSREFARHTRKELTVRMSLSHLL